MRFELTFQPTNNVRYGGGDADELERLVASSPPDGPFQLWISRSGGEAFCVLANGEWAYLSILRPTEEDWIATNPQHPDSTATTPIYLDNGQLDDMAVGQCVPRSMGIEAGLFYFRNGTPSPDIVWQQT